MHPCFPSRQAYPPLRTTGGLLVDEVEEAEAEDEVAEAADAAEAPAVEEEEEEAEEEEEEGRKVAWMRLLLPPPTPTAAGR